ncbi:MAG: hypothetical protein ACM3JI_05745, partial [Anaerolineae bacterium]
YIKKGFLDEASKLKEIMNERYRQKIVDQITRPKEDEGTLKRQQQLRRFYLQAWESAVQMDSLSTMKVLIPLRLIKQSMQAGFADLVKDFLDQFSDRFEPSALQQEPLSEVVEAYLFCKNQEKVEELLPLFFHPMRFFKFKKQLDALAS